MEHHTLDVLRWCRLAADASGAATRDDALGRLRLLLDVAMLEAEGRLLVVRVTLSGECAAHAELVASPTETLQHVRAMAAETAGPDQLWIEAVVLDTRPAVDLSALQSQPGPPSAPWSPRSTATRPSTPG